VSSVGIVGSRAWPSPFGLRVVALGIGVQLVISGAEIVGTSGFEGKSAFVGVKDEISCL